MRGAIGAAFVGLALVLATPVLAADPLQTVPLPVKPPVALPSLPVPVPTAQPAPVPVPQVQLPALPVQPPAVSSPPAGGGSPSRSLPGNAPSAARGSTGRVRDTSSAQGASGAPAPSAGGGTSSGGSVVTSTFASRAEQRHVTARERRFRRAVRRLSDCLDALPLLSRRVLVLRAGVGEQRVLSVAQTARRVDRRERAVRRIERRALRQLKAADRAGSCGEPVPDGAGAPAIDVSGSELAAAGTAATGATGATGAAGAAGGQPGSGGGDGGSSGGAGGGSSGGDRGGVKGEQRERSSERSPSFPGSLVSPAGEGIPVWLWIVLALAGLGWLAVTRIRRRRRIERIRYY